MKVFFNSPKSKALVTIIFVMFGLMLYTASTNNCIIGNLLGLAATPMQKVSTVVTNNAHTSAENIIQSKEDLTAENKALKKQVNKLNKKLIKYYTYQQENAQLRKFLELKNDNKDFKPVSAAVIGRDPTNVFYDFQIDKGSLYGISVNDPVITESGIIGWVSSVNSSYSKVTSILSADTKIGAIDKVNRDSGVVCSDIKFADRGLVKLSYLTAGTTVKPGDIIVSNGLGGRFPRNLPIGTVTSIKNSSYDVSLYAEVKPFADVKKVRDVMVITSFEGQGQVLKDVLSAEDK